jgi:hypothetical protein
VCFSLAVLGGEVGMVWVWLAGTPFIVRIGEIAILSPILGAIGILVLFGIPLIMILIAPIDKVERWIAHRRLSPAIRFWNFQHFYIDASGFNFFLAIGLFGAVGSFGPEAISPEFKWDEVERVKACLVPKTTDTPKMVGIRAAFFEPKPLYRRHEAADPPYTHFFAFPASNATEQLTRLQNALATYAPSRLLDSRFQQGDVDQ